MWGLGILNGFAITARNWMRGPMTVQYPEERLTLPERARWTVTHRFNEDGSPKCTACLICERECPDYVLKLEVTVAEDKSKHIDRYVYEVGACMMCGLCVDACPYDAIFMSHEYELATQSPEDLSRVLLEDVDAAPIPRRGKAEEPAPAA